MHRIVPQLIIDHYRAGRHRGEFQAAGSSDPATVSSISSAVDLAIDANHTCISYSVTALNTGIKCWGLNADGQLGNGTNTDSPVPVDVK